MSGQRPRGFVLIAVLVIIGSAALVATSLLFVAQGRSADAATSAETAQSRALAWSGLQAVMSRINDQRDRFLASELPQLDRQFTLYETQRRMGVVRILPMSSDGQSLLSPESGKLDVNSIDADALVRTGKFDTAAAAAVIAYRDSLTGRSIQSVPDLLNAPGAGLTPESIYGPLADMKPRDQAQMLTGDLAQRVAARLDIPHVRGLADLLTAFSVEPALQNNGERRINLNLPWSDALAAVVRQQFGDAAAQALKQVFDRGVKFDRDSVIVQTLIASKVEPENWPPILDAFTTDSGENHFGRLDLNTASEEALQSLPTVTPEQAAQIVATRQQLAAEDRATIAWPVVAQVLQPEQLQEIAGKVTTRCWVYRVRIAAGEVDADVPDGPLTNPMIWEAVLDFSSSRPRIAYLRDITLIQAAAQVALATTSNQPVEFDRPEPVVGESAPPAQNDVESAIDDQPAPNEEAESHGESADADADAEASEPPPQDAPVLSPAADQSPTGRRRIGRWTSGG